MELILFLSSLSVLKYLPVHHNLFSVKYFIQDILKICSMFFKILTVIRALHGATTFSLQIFQI